MPTLPLHHPPTTLRRLRVTDLRAFQAYRADPIVAQFQSWTAMNDDQATAFISGMATVTPLMRPGHWTQIAVADAATDALLGDMGLHLSADETGAEIGITLARAAQGQGHATRAVGLATALLFETTPITRIRAYADMRNVASCALMVRAGFVQTGVEVAGDLHEAVFDLRRPTAPGA